jgi:cellulose biosynthesis protein BcsQ
LDRRLDRSLDMNGSRNGEQRPGRERVQEAIENGFEDEHRASLVEDLLANSQRASRVLLDLDPECGWLVGRLARSRPTILVPLAPDMNSIVSLQAVEGRFGGMKDAEGNPLRPFYLLNQFDPLSRLHRDVREMLGQQLGERLLPFVVRRAAAVGEALAEGMTIVDYAPESDAAHDYFAVANWVRTVTAAVPGVRGPRWSERWNEAWSER